MANELKKALEAEAERLRKLAALDRQKKAAHTIKALKGLQGLQAKIASKRGSQ